jgi:hypothetical protein
MERGVEIDLAWVWRLCAVVLIYPISIVAGANGVLLLVSTVCVDLESWSAEGAMSNLSLGFPLVAGITALWASTLCPHPWLARNRYRFVLVATGLLVGLGVDGVFVIDRFKLNPNKAFSLEFHELWMIVGPLVASCVNLALLINARNHINDDLVPAPVRVVPPSHLTTHSELRPVILERYRPPISNR